MDKGNNSFVNNFKYGLYKAKKNYDCYLFLLPFAAIFFIFTVLPVVISIFCSFTYYNILEAPKFIGIRNYINLFVNDEVFLKAMKNTLIIAAISGPVSYIASLLFAWFINELSPKMRALMVVIFYAPSISGAVYLMWSIIFSGDSYGYINALLMSLGLVTDPIQFFTDPAYMMPTVIIVILWMSLGTGFLSFVAGFQTIDKSLFEAGYVDGIKNRWQELWFITLPAIRPQMLFGAVMSITASFAVSDVTTNLAGFPSTDYAVHTVVNHLMDYGGIRFEMGYACAISTLLFAIMIGSNKIVQKVLNKVGQ